MPKIAKQLTDREVRALSHPGGSRRNAVFAVGGSPAGLALQVTPSGARSWILRATINGKRRSMGLGAYPVVTLADARHRAREAALEIERGNDPIEDRRAARAAEAGKVTFRVAAEATFEKRRQGFRSERHAANWWASLERYVNPVIGTKPVCEICLDDLEKVLRPHWTVRNDTANRVRQRIEAVLDWSIAKKLRDPYNPASKRGGVVDILPDVRPKQEHMAAVQQPHLREWYRLLCERSGVAAAALRLVALTATRSGEVRGAVWSEFDLAGAVWTIPGERTKTRNPYAIPLSRAALSVLEAQPRGEGDDIVFPSPRARKALSDMSLLKTMRVINAAAGGRFTDRDTGRSATPHGLRSSFRDWAAGAGIADSVAERCLGHRVGDSVARAYLRADHVEQRREALEAWAVFLGAYESGQR